MKRIDSATARADINGTGKTGFSDNADLNGQDATYLTPEWLNVLQEELCALIELNGHLLDASSRQQLFDILATTSSLDSLKQDIETQLELMATQTALQQAIDYLSQNLQSHKDATNPHPQYLLSSTFGVYLLMTAEVGSTPTDDEHNILGWDGESGQHTETFAGALSYGRSGSGTITFKPYRCYGDFLLHAVADDMYLLRFTAKIYDKDAVLTSEKVVYEDSQRVRDKQCDAIITIPSGGYCDIFWEVSISTSHRGSVTCAFYVDDRPKRFVPVGYTSVVDNSDVTESSTTEQADGYDIYPEYQWFYYSDSVKSYIELSALSTLDSPVNHVPHYHRGAFTEYLSTDLWVLVQVGTQSVEIPESDYAVVDTQVLRASTEADGDVVIEIPLSMRSVSSVENASLVYRVAYYSTEVVAAETLPDGSIDGIHTIYVQPT